MSHQRFSSCLTLTYSLPWSVWETDRCVLLYLNFRTLTWWQSWCISTHVGAAWCIATTVLRENILNKVVNLVFVWERMKVREPERKTQRGVGGSAMSVRRGVGGWWYLQHRREREKEREKSMGIWLISIWIKFQRQGKDRRPVHSLLLGMSAADEQNHSAVCKGLKLILPKAERQISEAWGKYEKGKPKYMTMIYWMNSKQIVQHW